MSELGKHACSMLHLVASSHCKHHAVGTCHGTCLKRAGLYVAPGTCLKTFHRVRGSYDSVTTARDITWQRSAVDLLKRRGFKRGTRLEMVMLSGDVLHCKSAK